jgi:hypothetical protein
MLWGQILLFLVVLHPPVNASKQTTPSDSTKLLLCLEIEEDFGTQALKQIRQQKLIQEASDSWWDCLPYLLSIFWLS